MTNFVAKEHRRQDYDVHSDVKSFPDVHRVHNKPETLTS